MTLRLLQHRAQSGERGVIAAQGDSAAFVVGFTSIRALALHAIAQGISLTAAVAAAPKGEAVDIAAEFEAGRLLAPRAKRAAPRFHRRCRSCAHR